MKPPIKLTLLAAAFLASPGLAPFSSPALAATSLNVGLSGTINHSCSILITKKGALLLSPVGPNGQKLTSDRPGGTPGGFRVLTTSADYMVVLADFTDFTTKPEAYKEDSTSPPVYSASVVKKDGSGDSITSSTGSSGTPPNSFDLETGVTIFDVHATMAKGAGDDTGFASGDYAATVTVRCEPRPAESE